MLHAIPFAISLTFPPVVVLGAYLGGGWVSVAVLYALLGIPLADAAVRQTSAALDPETGEEALFWHRLLTWVWLPVQLVRRAKLRSSRSAIR